MKKFLIALQFLTILPIKIESRISGEHFGQSLIYFPVVGILIGAILALSAFIFSFLPPLILGVFILMLSIIITGGVHLDGFADTCDAFYGSKPAEKILEIMRDSHIGVMGVTGVVCLLLLKFTLIASISQGALWKALIMMGAFARWSQVLACYMFKYARENGKAKFFIEYADLKQVIIGAIATLAVFLILANLKGLILFILAFIPVILFMYYTKQKIGGMTGDTIGATSEIAEAAILLFAMIYLGG